MSQKALEGINVQGVITRRGNGIIGLFSNDRIGRSVMNEFTADVSGLAVPNSTERMATSLVKAYTFVLFFIYLFDRSFFRSRGGGQGPATIGDYIIVNLFRTHGHGGRASADLDRHLHQSAVDLHAPGKGAGVLGGSRVDRTIDRLGQNRAAHDGRKRRAQPAARFRRIRAF